MAGQRGWRLLFLLLLSAGPLAVWACSEPVIWRAACRTAVLGGAVVAGSLLLGTPLALVLVRGRLSGRRVLQWLVLSLVTVPLYLQAAAWESGFGKLGWYALAAGGVEGQLAGLPGAIWVQTWAAVPWAAILLALGLGWVEPELEAAARLEASPLAVFTRVVLPRALPAVATAAVWNFSQAAVEMTVSDLYLVDTLARELYTGLAFGDGLAACWWRVLPPVLLGSVWCGWLLCWAGRRYPAPRRGPLPGHGGSSTGGRLMVPGWAAWLLLGAVLLPLLAVPVGSLIYTAGRMPVAVGEPATGGWSWSQLVTRMIAAPARYRQEVGWSLLVGSLAASLAVAAAVPVAWCARRGGAAEACLLLLAGGGLMLPAPLIGLTLIGILNQPQWPWLIWCYDRTVLAPVLAAVIRVWPPVTLLLWYLFRRIPADLWEAVQLDGGGFWTGFSRVLLPLGLPAVRLAWILALLISVGELAATILVVPPGMMTLSVRIFGLLHSGVTEEVACICLWTLAVIPAGAWLLLLGTGRWRVALGEKGG